MSTPPTDKASDGNGNGKNLPKIGAYEIFGGTLGRGRFTTVKRGRHLDTGDAVAIKVIDKGRLEAHEQLDDMKKEIAIMKMLNHENVISLKDLYATATKLYMIVDLQQGGDLYTKVRREGALGETVARFLFQQLVLGLDHCHAMGIAHGSLCPECILFDKDGHLKISDFGSASLDFDSPEDAEDETSMYLEQFYFVSPHSHDSSGSGGAGDGGSNSNSSNSNSNSNSSNNNSSSSNSKSASSRSPSPFPSPSRPSQAPLSPRRQSARKLQLRGGSLHYKSPEVTRNDCYDGKKADVWSIGVILYVMLTGRLPFGYTPDKADGSELIESLERKISEHSAADIDALVGNICEANYAALPREYYTGDSALLIGLVLEPEPAHRPYLGRVIRHEWCRWGDVSAITRASSFFEPAIAEATTESGDQCSEATFLPSFICNPFGVFGTKEAPLPRTNPQQHSSPWPSTIREERDLSTANHPESATRSSSSSSSSSTAQGNDHDHDHDTGSLLDDGDNGSLIGSIIAPSTVVTSYTTTTTTANVTSTHTK